MYSQQTKVKYADVKIEGEFDWVHEQTKNGKTGPNGLGVPNLLINSANRATAEEHYIENTLIATDN